MYYYAVLFLSEFTVPAKRRCLADGAKIDK